MLYISDVQYYVPVKLCKTPGSIHLCKITVDKVKLHKYYVWDILEIDWSEVKVTFNGKVINLPKSITIKIWDKFKVRWMIGNQPLLFHLMLKQGFNWFLLTIIPFPSLHRKIQAYQDKNRQTSAWNKGHAVPYFPTQPQPKHRCTLRKTRTRWSNQRHRFNPIKTEHYNM